MSKRKPLTLEELRKMDGKPAYWPDDKSYGIISVDSTGKWAGIPFFRGRKNEVNFEFDIESRGMEVYEIDPPRLNREAWEPCEFCNSCDNCEHAMSNVHEYPCYDCTGEDRVSYPLPFFTAVGYCKSCGRPLTEEAWAMLEKRMGG